jgi:hypothetical protein
MSSHAREVGFFNFATLELWLHKFGKMSCAGENNQTCRIGIQPVRRSWFLWMINRLQDRLECVAVEPAAGVDWQRGGFVDDQKSLILMQNSDIDADLWFHVSGSFTIKAVSSMSYETGLDRLESRIEQAGIFKNPLPILMRCMAENRGYGFKDGDFVVFRWNHNRAKVVTRHAAGQGSSGIPNRFLPMQDAQLHFLFLRFEAKRTGLTGDIAGIVLITLREWREAAETLGGIGFAQGGINADALVEDEALAVVVRPAAFLEVFQDAAIELMDIPEALAFHVGACLFTTYAAGAEHHHGFVFE